MARWKLTEKHYLNVPGTRWEFQTVDRMTGRPQRKVYEVPLFLDPENEQDWTWKDGFDGAVIVCHEGKGEPRDLVFVGDPTPGMLPLDDEATAITAKFSWTPTAGLDEDSKSNSYQNQLLMGMIDQMAELQTKATAAPMAAGMEQFLTMMTQMMEKQTQILAAIADKQVMVQALAIDPEQVVNEEEPLPEADEPTAEEIAASAEAYAAAQAASSREAEAKLAKSSLRR